MFNDPEQSIVTREKWEEIKKKFPRHFIGEVVERQECCLPVWFVPFARGVAIASDWLLKAVRHYPGRSLPRNWEEPAADCFLQVKVPKDIFDPKGVLLVRECGETNLWTIERLGLPRQYTDVDEVLVHQLGSTPIFTRCSQSAIRLAMYCQAYGALDGFRWIKVVHEDEEAAPEIFDSGGYTKGLRRQHPAIRWWRLQSNNCEGV
jgi:hypothetical protein